MSIETRTVRALVDDGILERPVDGNHGELHPKTADFVPHGIPFVMASDLVNGEVDTEHCSFISHAQAETLRKGFAKPGDVLLSHKATMGRTAIVRAVPTSYIVLTPQVTYYRVRDLGRLDRRYLKYYFDSPDFQELLASWSNAGSTRAYLGITAQLELPIELPSIGFQRAIGSTLGALDEKIRANRVTARLLGTLATTLFNHWIERNEAHLIERKVGDLLADGTLYLSDGYRAKNSEMAAGGLPFARAGNLNGGFHFMGADVLSSVGVAAAGEKVCRTFDCVFTSKGTVGRTALVLPSTPRFVYSPQLCFWRSLTPRKLHPLVLYQWMCGPEFAGQVDAVKGQTDMADYVNLRDQRAMIMTLPWGVPQDCLTHQLESLNALFDVLQAMNRTLAALRDTLLRALFSGDITIRQAEKAVAKVI